MRAVDQVNVPGRLFLEGDELAEWHPQRGFPLNGPQLRSRPSASIRDAWMRIHFCVWRTRCSQARIGNREFKSVWWIMKPRNRRPSDQTRDIATLTGRNGPSKA
jgi:hypothetical protein